MLILYAAVGQNSMFVEQISYDSLDSYKNELKQKIIDTLYSMLEVIDIRYLSKGN